MNYKNYLNSFNKLSNIIVKCLRTVGHFIRQSTEQKDVGTQNDNKPIVSSTFKFYHNRPSIICLHVHTVRLSIVNIILSNYSFSNL